MRKQGLTERIERDKWAIVASLGRLPAKQLLLVLIFCGCCAPLRAQVVSIPLGDQTIEGKLLFEDEFDDLSHWTVESTCRPYTENNRLVWPCAGETGMGTIWCNQRFEGPTLVTYEVVPGEGMQNINFFAYASHPDGLLATTDQRSGHYDEYHSFQNYIITFLTNEAEQWRVRFRKNPGFNLLDETYVGLDTAAGQPHQMAYLFDESGNMTLFVDQQRILTVQDTATYRSGYLGLRTWRSNLSYRHFRVYALPGKP